MRRRIEVRQRPHLRGGHEAHFTVARWGHDNSTTAENPRNHAGGDEYWDFYPKGSNFNDVTDTEIASMQQLLNGRPRKTLQFYTPREKLHELTTGVALAT